jgi:hypothetical protein
MIARSTALTEILCGWQSPQYFFYPASFLAVKTPIRHSSAGQAAAPLQLLAFDRKLVRAIESGKSICIFAN